LCQQIIRLRVRFTTELRSIFVLCITVCSIEQWCGGGASDTRPFRPQGSAEYRRKLGLGTASVGASFRMLSVLSTKAMFSLVGPASPFRGTEEWGDEGEGSDGFTAGSTAQRCCPRTRHKAVGCVPPTALLFLCFEPESDEKAYRQNVMAVTSSNFRS
jgi:hypothetical protein